jgi:hypothetical protein
MEDLLTSVRAVLAATPARWQALADAAPVELLTLAPASGEWSALACLQHLIDTERDVFPVRIEVFLAGRELAAWDPADSRGSDTPAELAASFARLRAASLALLDRVTPADLARETRHAELGMVTLAEMLHEWAGHDLMHTVQAERALLQPFIAGCGPWRPYFRDHDMGR